jgi:hypothetical protein
LEVSEIEGDSAPASLAAPSARALTALAVITVSLPGVSSMTVLLATLRPNVSSRRRSSSAISATRTPTTASTTRMLVVKSEMERLPRASTTPR